MITQGWTLCCGAGPTFSLPFESAPSLWPFGVHGSVAVAKSANHPAGEGGRNGTAIQQPLFDYIITPVMYVMHEDF